MESKSTPEAKEVTFLKVINSPPSESKDNHKGNGDLDTLFSLHEA